MELALTRGTISSSYLDVMCNGVAQRDVEALLLPEPPFEKPGEDGTRKRRHDALMRRADAAADAGDARESCALAEEAYGLFRSFRALVLFADARSACGEPHLAAALLHSALRVLALSPSEHAHAQELLADVEQQLLSRSSGGAARPPRRALRPAGAPRVAQPVQRRPRPRRRPPLAVQRRQRQRLVPRVLLLRIVGGRPARGPAAVDRGAAHAARRVSGVVAQQPPLEPPLAPSRLLA